MATAPPRRSQHKTYVTALAQATLCPVLNLQRHPNAAKHSVNLRDDRVAAAHFPPPINLTLPHAVPLPTHTVEVT